jgi:activator of Hsp90 ATPase-like protein
MGHADCRDICGIFEADGDGTVLSLRHIGLPDGEAAAMHEEGWRHFTARLALAARRPNP